MNINHLNEMHGGRLIGEVLAKQGVQFLYTLCGGHISPILTGAEEQGIRIIDVRDEANAVFAADATARLTGIPGVAAVTAGPGLTNTLTAVKNAQMAQSPLILLGGAAATLLQGRGALQDIDQISLLKPIVKMAKSVRRVRDIVPSLEEAFRVAQSGVPGPVFLELPVDLLYQESIVNDWAFEMVGKKGVVNNAIRGYLKVYNKRLFRRAWRNRGEGKLHVDAPVPSIKELDKLKDVLMNAKKPVLVVGSQAMVDASNAAALQEAVFRLNIPTFLSGMARGLLGKHPLHIRHKRSKAMREADVVILAGLPADFRLGYGMAIPRSATYVNVNRSKEDMNKNRRPSLGISADAGTTLRLLAANWPYNGDKWAGWRTTLQERNDARDVEIHAKASQKTEFVNPVRLCQQIEDVVADDSILIGDGGDFVGTASYIVRPRAPLCWLDPGAFGTLGSGGGFAIASKLVRPSAEVWLLYGDGSAGYTLAEFDTFARHKLPVIAIIGNDASWAQIAREQVEILGTSLGTDLVHTNYHIVAEGYGGVGLSIDHPDQVAPTLQKAKEIAASGRPVCVNVLIGKTDFRKGSLSM